ncbi:signal peptidase I [Clostridiales bacterium oral taxon 876 str. F0540]|nr:signal peptidase I [Clostridiales bacterium oral taxon 876 str. F0540]
MLFMLLMILFYSTDSPYIASKVNGFIFSYVLKPILWISLALMIYKSPRIHPKGKFRFRSFTNWWAFNFAFIFVAMSVVGGLVDGFGKSPYSHSINGMFLNILLVGSTIVGREMVRSYLVNSLNNNKERYIVFILVSIATAFIAIPLNLYNHLGNFQALVKFIAQYFAPEFSKGLFASYLVYIGGSVPAIIYMGTIEAVNWLSPILPNLKWITSALIGVLCPVFSFMAFQGMYLKESKQKTVKDDKEENILGWIATTVFSIGILWFSLGVFPIYPSVIATGSMEPLIMPGDVTLVRKSIDRLNLKPGDIIQFKSDNILISHRIIDKLEIDGQEFYKTKGDNNSVADSNPVKPEDIKGTVVKVIPKIGWPTLLLKSRNDIPLEKVQF